MIPLLLMIGAYLIVGHALKAKLPQVFAEPPPPKPHGDVMSTMQSKFDPAYPMTGVYKSDPNMVELRDGVSSDGVMLGPLWDPVSQLYARLDQRDAEKALARFGMRLMSRAEWKELHARRDGSTLLLKPVTLVTKAADQYAMRSLGFQKKHDDAMNAQIAAAGGINGRILLNAGKHYNRREAGDDLSKEREEGWDRPETDAYDPIQPSAQAHEATYTDYSQLTQGRRE